MSVFSKDLVQKYFPSPLKATKMIKKHFIFGEWCSIFNNVKFPSLNFRLLKLIESWIGSLCWVRMELEDGGWRDTGQSLIVASGKVHINYLLSIIIWVQVNTIGHDWHKLSFQWKILYLFGNSGLGYFNISVYLGKMQLLILEMQDNLQKTSFT